MSAKSERKQAVKLQKQAAASTKGFVVRKKYLDSDEWNYFTQETSFAFIWSPASAGASMAVFPTRQAAERMVKRVEEYHNWRHQQGDASGFDVSVEEVNLPEASAK